MGIIVTISPVSRLFVRMASVAEGAIFGEVGKGSAGKIPKIILVPWSSRKVRAVNELL